WLKNLAKQKQKFKTLPAHEAIELKEKLNEELEKARKFLNEKFYNMLESKGIKISKEEFLELKPFHWGFEFYEVFDLEKPKEERGFDVIIGNPPYGNILTNIEKDIVKMIYPFKVALTEHSLKGSHNSAAIFIERSYSIMNNNGKFSFIVPNTIARKDEFQKLRWFILNQTYCYELADVGNPFKHSGVNLEMIIIFYGYTKPQGDHKIKILSKRFEKPKCTKVFKSKFEKIGWLAFYHDKIFDYLLSKPKLGLHGRFFGAARPSKLKVKVSSTGDTPVVKGNGIKRFFLNKIYYIKKNKNVEAYVRSLSYPILILPEVSGSVQATIINDKILPISGVEIWEPKYNNLNKKYLLIILNSRLLTYYYYKYIINCSELTTHLDSTYLERLPFMVQDNQQPFIILCDYMLFLNATEERRTAEKELIEFIDKQIIDSLVYELYFKEKFEQDGIKTNLLELVEPYLKDISNLSSEEQKLQIIKKVVEKIENDKKIMEQIEKIKSHPWIRVIESREK
ncbi:MAG: Eco57I restriction-modification methylase domain-containing protein, partial [Thermoproteota archaeon]